MIGIGRDRCGQASGKRSKQGAKRDGQGSCSYPVVSINMLLFFESNTDVNGVASFQWRLNALLGIRWPRYEDMEGEII